MKKTILILTLLGLTACAAQENIAPLEPAKNHYLSLQKYSDKTNSKRSELDAVQYPASLYNSSLIFVLAKTSYLSEQQVEYLKTVVKFPANSSDQTRAELDYLLEWQNKRTTQQKERAEVLARVGYWPHISLLKDHPRYQENLEHLFFEGREILGDQCKAENYPHTTKLLEGVTNDMRVMEFTVKYHLLRPRPYHLESKLQPMARISSPSFASGHTLWAYIQAFVWSELIPEKRKAFLALAYEIGESREIMGIHYPSDEEAARVLAHKMLELMVKNKTFKKDLANAKNEWK